MVKIYCLTVRRATTVNKFSAESIFNFNPQRKKKRNVDEENKCLNSFKVILRI